MAEFPPFVSAFGERAPLRREFAGLRVEEIARPGIAAIAARKDQDAALADALSRGFALAPPHAGQCAHANKITLIAAGPSAFLAFKPEAGYAFASECAQALQAHASVADQSSAYCWLRLSGPRARETLQKAVFLDLSAEAFAPGAAAISVMAHIGAVLWRESADECYDLAAFRSYAFDLLHMLEIIAQS